jgi:hypothetical protein
MDTQKVVAEIDAEISRLQQVKALLTGTSTTENRNAGRSSVAGSSGKKRTLSAEARERIAAAQRTRWAKAKKAVKRAARHTSAVPARKKAATANPAVKSAKKRTVSPEARARMAAGQTARWAKVKKAGKKTARGAATSPAERAAIPAKGARKSIPAKKARPGERANAPNTKASVAPPAPATSPTVVS